MIVRSPAWLRKKYVFAAPLIAVYVRLSRSTDPLPSAVSAFRPPPFVTMPCDTTRSMSKENTFWASPVPVLTVSSEILSWMVFCSTFEVITNLLSVARAAMSATAVATLPYSSFVAVAIPGSRVPLLNNNAIVWEPEVAFHGATV